MKVFTVFSHAGGAGKSTLARELAFALNRKGAKVLLVDLDPQANLTFWLLGEEVVPKEETLLPYIQGKGGLPEPRLVRQGLDLIPSNLDFAVAEVVLRQEHLREMLFRTDLRTLDYDVAIIDSLPSLGHIAILGALAADGLIVPVETTAKGLQALEGVLTFAEEYAVRLARLGAIPRRSSLVQLFVPTRYDGRTLQHRGALEAMERLKTIAPVSSPLAYRPAVYAEAVARRTSAAEISSEVAREVEGMMACFLPLVGLESEEVADA